MRPKIGRRPDMPDLYAPSREDKEVATSELPAEAPEVSIVMPCLDEAETLATCIGKARSAIAEHGLNAEIVVADNGSTDGSQKIAADLGARVVDVNVRGYGAALRAGIQSARGRYVVMADADDSYDFAAIYPFVARLREGADLVMGNRFAGGIRPGAMPPLHRWLGNPVLSAVGRLFFGAAARDFHCGMRAFTKDAFAKMNLQTSGMEFASEMVVRATLLRLRTVEVPVILYPDGRHRRPHLKTWSDGWRHLRFLLLFSPRWLFLVPGLALMVAGTALAAAVLPGPLRLGPFGLDIQTLLVAAFAALVGYQLVVFAAFTKIFAIREGLHPPDPRLNNAFRFVRLEHGALGGAAMALAGAITLLVAFLRWQSFGFGVLDPEMSLRIVIPAVVVAALGVQTVFASFFLSILGMPTRSRSAPGAEP